ncbi:MAG: hypothetical protein LUD81_03425, partial [Clostridiales bacterium]|nr:hypothetical protein [Clostridiales bacterium]
IYFQVFLFPENFLLSFPETYVILYFRILFVLVKGFRRRNSQPQRRSNRRLFLTFLIAYERGDAYDLSDYLRDYVKKEVILSMLKIIYDVHILAVIIVLIVRIVVKIVYIITKNNRQGA